MIRSISISLGSFTQILAAGACAILMLIPVSAKATVIQPESVLRADAPVLDPRTGAVDHVPVTLHVRETVLLGELTLPPEALRSGLRLERLSTQGIPGANGYRTLHYRLYGADPSVGEFPVRVSLDGEVHGESLSLAPAMEVTSLDASTQVVREPVARIDLAPFGPPPPTRTAPAKATGPTAGPAAPRMVRVHGRLLFEMENGDRHGADDITIQVVQPVDILSDNVLAEFGTDVNGDFDHEFELDRDRDIYLKILARNRAANVGTGLFFDTYSRRYNYDDFSGTEIDFGERVFLGDFNRSLWIVHALTRAHRWNAGQGQELGRVNVRYPDNSRAVSWYMPTAGLEGIHLRSDDAFNTNTLYHEYGHHFVYQRASANVPLYCNGMCEPDGSCGHCFWCEENASVAWSEGFPYWLSEVMRWDHADRYGYSLPYPSDQWQTELIQGCWRRDHEIQRARPTEGMLCALLVDLVDTFNENDPAFTEDAADRSTLTAQDIIHVATTNPKPATSHGFVRRMSEYLQTRPGTTELIIADFWSTVRNNGLDEDDVPPTAPVAISSTTHPVGVVSASNVPQLLFGGATDDFSGVQGHYVTMTRDAPAAPDDSGRETRGSAITWNTPLAPGTWYANVRSVDGAGNRSLDHASYGPMLVAPPGPVDFAPVVDFLWEDALVVRNTPDATPTAAGFPAVLDSGDVYVSYRFRNLPPGGTPGDTLFTLVHFDGNLRDVWQSVESVFGGGETWTRVNLGPFHISPGRHRVSFRMDGWDRVAESDEENNLYGLSLVVNPKPLTAGAWSHEPAPPYGTGGEIIAPGTPPNQAGFRFAPSRTFGAVMIDTDSQSSFNSYTLSAYQPSTGPLNGFRNRLDGESASGGTAALVVAPSGSADGGAFDFGVHKAEAPRPYRIRAYNAETLPRGTAFERILSGDEMLLLFELSIGPNDIGYFNLTLEAEYESTPEDQMLEAFWVTEADTAKALRGRDAVVFGDGVLSFTEHIKEPGNYAIALKRRIRHSGELSPVTLRIASHSSPLPQVTIPTEDPKWTVPLLPIPEASKEDTLMFPAILAGDAAQTFVNFALINTGDAPTPAAPVRFFVDAQPIIDHDFGAVNPGERVEYRHGTPIRVPGGRHTLALVADPDNAVDELWDGTHVYALQFGWTGKPLNPLKPLQRAYPPDPVQWLSHVAVVLLPDPVNSGEGSAGKTLTHQVPNCDGVRFDPSLAGKSGTWHGVGAMPSPGEDIDLALFAGDVPAADAFVDPIAGSHAGISEPEYLLVSGAGAAAAGGVFSGATSPVFDVGVYGVLGSNVYTIHAEAAEPLSSPMGETVHGTFMVDPGRVLRLHEVYLAPGVYRFEARNKSKTGRIGLSLHAPMVPGRGSHHGGDDRDAGAASNRSEVPGADVALAVEVRPGEEGLWCLAAWKPAAEELGDLMGYQLVSSASPSVPTAVEIDGTAESAYGPARAVQTLPTSAGNSLLGQVDHADGSELDQVFARIADETLYLTFAGNLRSDLSHLEVFLDTRPGGQNELRGDNTVLPGDPLGRMGNPGTGGLRFEDDFAADWYLSVFCGETPFRVTALMAELPTAGGGTGRVLGSTTAASNGILYGGDNPHGVRLTVDNRNTAGIEDGGGAVSGAGVTTGVELAIPLTALGDPGTCFQVVAFLNSPMHDDLANQTLPPLPAGTGHLGEPRLVDLAVFPGKQSFLVCPALPLDVDEDPTGVGIDGLRLLAPTRNPFQTQTTIRLAVTTSQSVAIDVFDIRGRLVRRLHDARLESGAHEIPWDGRDDHGQHVASGVYHLRVSADEGRRSQRLIVTR